jgi:RimJ/RimL family protein N-acetyltransferase
MRLETARLVIRTFEPRDAEPWLAMVADEEVRRFLPAGPVPTMDTFQSALERRRAWSASTAQQGLVEQGYATEAGCRRVSAPLRPKPVP